MKIDLNIDTKDYEQRFELSAKQVAYAAVNAINRTMKDVQKRERDNARAKFHLRGGSGEQLILRSVAKIFQFANVNQGKSEGVIGIDEPKPRMQLTGLELGGVKTPFMGSRVAVPITGTAARPSMDSSVPGNLQLANLGLQPGLSNAQRQQRRSIKGSNAKETRAMRSQFTRAAGTGQVWKGKERTYMIPAVGVFQRSGSGKSSSTSLIYKFVPRPVLRPVLGFQNLAIGQGDPLLARYLEEETAKALVHNAERG